MHNRRGKRKVKEMSNKVINVLYLSSFTSSLLMENFFPNTDLCEDLKNIISIQMYFLEELKQGNALVIEELESYQEMCLEMIDQIKALAGKEKRKKEMLFDP